MVCYAYVGEGGPTIPPTVTVTANHSFGIFEYMRALLCPFQAAAAGIIPNLYLRLRGVRIWSGSFGKGWYKLALGWVIRYSEAQGTY